jgi:hypothetical protein
LLPLPASGRGPGGEVLLLRLPTTPSILDNLRKAGVKGTDKSQRIGFDRLDPFPGVYVQAEGVTDAGAAVRVSVGPEFGTVGDQWIKDAALARIIHDCGLDGRRGPDGREQHGVRSGSTDSARTAP